MTKSRVPRAASRSGTLSRQYIRLILASMPTVITLVSPAQRLSKTSNHVGQFSMKTPPLNLMDHISYNTFFRAFSAVFGPQHSNLAEAAGDYENTTCTKIAKGVAGVLTLGIGYGIIRVMEHYCNVAPKVDEFREAAVKLHATIKNSPLQRGVNAEVSVRTRSGEEIKFCETASGVQVVDNAGNRADLPRFTIARLKLKLDADFNANGHAYLPYFLAQNLLSEESNFQPSEKRGVSSNTEAFNQEFEALTLNDRTSIMQSDALKVFMPLAVAFLSHEDHRRFSVEVANFLTGNASQMPEGLDEPHPGISAEEKIIIRDLLHISENELPDRIFDEIKALHEKVCPERVDNLFPFTDSNPALLRGARNDDTSFLRSESSQWHPWA